MAPRKGPNTALRCILRHCDVPKSTRRAWTPQCRLLHGWLKSGPHSSGFGVSQPRLPARLVFGPFGLAILIVTLALQQSFIDFAARPSDFNS